jgi:hypothetical protein
MSGLDHHEFDLAAFKGSRRKSVASHLFDDRPICKKVLLRQYLRWELGLQNAALPRVPIRNPKRYRLRSLVDPTCATKASRRILLPSCSTRQRCCCSAALRGALSRPEQPRISPPLSTGKATMRTASQSLNPWRASGDL